MTAAIGDLDGRFMSLAMRFSDPAQELSCTIGAYAGGGPSIALFPRFTHRSTPEGIANPLRHLDDLKTVKKSTCTGAKSLR
jgi:hypothetical protein